MRLQPLNPKRRTLRTAVQVIVAVVAVAPVLVDQMGLDTTVGVGAAIVAAASILARVMAIPEVDAWLAKVNLDAAHSPPVE